MRAYPAVFLLFPLIEACTASRSNSPRREPSDRPPVERQYLSGTFDDWEPSLGVGGDNVVSIIATRSLPAPAGAARPALGQAIVWTSQNGGRTFDTAVFASPTQHMQGDPRIKADNAGNIYASWIGLNWDSTGRGPDPKSGALMLAVSRDRGRTFTMHTAATQKTGIGDKPELAITPDGQKVFLAYMGAGTLDLATSNDSGRAWNIRVVDTMKMMHWPSGSSLAPNGTLYVAHPHFFGRFTDTIANISLRLLRIADGGSSLTSREYSRSSRLGGRGKCMHGETCPVQMPYAGVATDARNRVYVAYTEGKAREVYGLYFLRSEDGGVTWSDPTPLSTAPRPSSGDRADNYYPMIAAAGDGLVYVMWFDDRTGPLNAWAKRSTDGGRTWSADVRLSSTDRDGMVGLYGEYGGLGIDSGGALHVTWGEGTGRISQGGKGGIWYARWDGRTP
jgi:hypothetical protein